jgi:hypothetical protein
MTARTSAEDMLHAAEWLDAYEAEDGDGERDHRKGPYTGTDETAATMYRVADWLRAEAARRAEEALIREVTRDHEQRTGRKPTRAQVRNAIANARTLASAREQVAGSDAMSSVVNAIRGAR